MSGFTVLAVPYFFQAGQSSTSFASPLLMFMATAPPRLDPTTTWGRCLSNSAWAMRDRLGEVLVGQLRVDDLVAVVLQVRRLHAAGDRLPAVEEENLHDVGGSLGLRQFGQYHGAGVKTGLGLRFRHLAQRSRLPPAAVLGRTRFPVVSRFFHLVPIAASDSARQPDAPPRPVIPS